MMPIEIFFMPTPVLSPNTPLPQFSKLREKRKMLCEEKIKNQQFIILFLVGV